RLLAQHSPDAVLLHDVTGRILDCNDRACEQLGYDMDSLRGMNIADLNAERSLEALQAFWQSLPPGPFAREGVIRRRDGTTFPSEVQGQVFIERGHRLYLISGRDLTAQKEFEENMAAARDAAMAASRAKSEFLASMSHEIRTPMNIILGMAELLAETPINAAQKGFIEAIETSGQILLRLINDILDLSQIEADRIVLRREPFSPAVLLEDVGAIMGVAAAQNNLGFALSLAPDLPLRVENDPDRVRQVLINLIWNAVKFTDTGHIEVRARRLSGDDGQDWLRIAVTDTGPGIPPEVRERLFDPFTQADGSTRRRHAGTGLGLAICKRLVERMGGYIACDTTPG
ncbi:MAG TPA: ATP-binding protein, partial [Holophaga sp.]|nr:ATP-binding protein [Holophaga sp.]